MHMAPHHSPPPFLLCSLHLLPPPMSSFLLDEYSEKEWNERYKIIEKANPQAVRLLKKGVFKMSDFGDLSIFSKSAGELAWEIPIISFRNEGIGFYDPNMQLFKLIYEKWLREDPDYFTELDDDEDQEFGCNFYYDSLDPERFSDVIGVAFMEDEFISIIYKGIISVRDLCLVSGNEDFGLLEMIDIFSETTLLLIREQLATFPQIIGFAGKYYPREGALRKIEGYLFDLHNGTPFESVVETILKMK